MVLKQAFSPTKHFTYFIFFFGIKIALKNIYHTLEDFSKFDPPFKSTVSSTGSFTPLWRSSAIYTYIKETKSVLQCAKKQ